MRRLPILFMLLGALSGCPNTDPAVFVEASIAEPAVEIAGAGPFGSELAGSFTLKLHLGARAADESEVSLDAFEIVDEKRETPIVSPLVLEAGVSPVTVKQDGDETVEVSFDSGKTPFEADVKAALCASAGIAIKGALRDSLRGSSTVVFSTTFHPSGC